MATLWPWASTTEISISLTLHAKIVHNIMMKKSAGNRRKIKNLAGYNLSHQVPARSIWRRTGVCAVPNIFWLRDRIIGVSNLIRVSIGRRTQDYLRSATTAGVGEPSVGLQWAFDGRTVGGGCQSVCLSIGPRLTDAFSLGGCPDVGRITTVAAWRRLITSAARKRVCTSSAPF